MRKIPLWPSLLQLALIVSVCGGGLVGFRECGYAGGPARPSQRYHSDGGWVVMKSYYDHPAMIYGRALTILRAAEEYPQPDILVQSNQEHYEGHRQFRALYDAVLDFLVRHHDVSFSFADNGSLAISCEEDAAAFKEETLTHWQKLFDLHRSNPGGCYMMTYGIATLNAVIRFEWSNLLAYLEKFPHVHFTISDKGKPVFADDEWRVHYLLSS